VSLVEQELLTLPEHMRSPPGFSVYRRTDNTLAKRKSTKGQTTIYKTYTKN